MVTNKINRAHETEKKTLTVTKKFNFAQGSAKRPIT